MVSSIYIAFEKKISFNLRVLVVKMKENFIQLLRFFIFIVLACSFDFHTNSCPEILSWEEVSQQTFSFEFVLWKIDQIEDLKLRFKFVIEFIWRTVISFDVSKSVRFFYTLSYIIWVWSLKRSGPLAKTCICLKHKQRMKTEV